MSLEAIKAVTRAEEDVSTKKAETVASCKRLLSDAEMRGRALLDNALTQAAKQEADTLAQAAAQAEIEAAAVLEKAASAANALEQGASAKIPDAVSFIVERIVST